MLAALPLAPSWQETTDTMTTRTLALIAIVAIALLLVAVAFAALFAGDISERAGGIVTSVLGTLATLLAGLLLFLRMETVAEKAANVESQVADLHHDVLNGGLRDNVKRAIHETENDPQIREQRVENVARGVSKDRHDKANRDTMAQNQRRYEELRKKRDGGQDG